MKAIHSVKHYSYILFLLPFSIYLLSGCKTGSGDTTDTADTTDSDLEKKKVISENDKKVILLEDLSGNEINLDDYKGKVVFLNFWATWCKPCIAEMPSIDRLKKSLGDEGFVFLAASDESLEKIENFTDRYPHDFKYVRLKTNIYSLGLSVLPTTFIINKKGKVVEKIIGAREWDSQESIEMLKNIYSN